MSIERVLIVGLGSIGRRHLRLARQLLPQADIRILRHRAEEQIPHSTDGVFSRLEDAISFAPRLAVIANPAPFHIPVAQPLARAGAHLLVEKPISDSLLGVPELLETCRQNGASLHIGYNLRFNSALMCFNKLLKQGRVGRVMSVRCEVGQFLPDWRTGVDYRQSVSARRVLGGGVLLELSHELDYLQWIFGEVEWVRAHLSRQSNLELDVEDTAHICLGFKPTIAHQELIAVAQLDFIRQDTTRYCLAIGEAGTLRWDGVSGSVDLYRQGGKEWERIFYNEERGDESYLAQLNNLIYCAENHLMEVSSGEDALKVMEIIEAARISADTGSTVSIERVRRREGAGK